MKLEHHGRYDYSAITRRADYSWPEGRRLAIHFSLNVEHFAFGEGIGNDYGIGFSFLDNRISGRLTRFTTDS